MTQIHSSNKKWWFLGFVIIGLIAFRAALPTIVKNYANRTLDKIPGYKGHIDDVDLSIWRGAYQIQGLDLKKIEGKLPIPFFRAKEIDLSVEWRQLFHGALVGKILVYSPQVNFVTGPTKAQEQTEIDGSWTDRVKDLIPLRINRFAIYDGEVHFRNYEMEPAVDIFLDKIQLNATNLTNSEKISKTLAATVEGKARAMRSGNTHLWMQIDPYAKQPTFDMTLKLEELDLRELNSFFKRYGAVEVKDGRFGLYTEAAAKEGAFKGYAKPIIQDLDIVKLKKEEKSFGEVIKGIFVKIGLWLFENTSKDRVGLRADFSGRLDDPKINAWGAAISLLKNAFIKAITPGLDENIQLKDGVDQKKKEDAKDKKRKRK